MSQENPFKWERHPKAEAFIQNVIEVSQRQNPEIEHLATELLKHTSTRLFDWVDYVIVGHSSTIDNELTSLGFVQDHTSSSYKTFIHPGAQLPKVVVEDRGAAVGGVAVTVERISDFLMVRGIKRKIEGLPFSGFRRSCISTINDVSLWVVERRGTTTMEPTYPEEEFLYKYLKASELWKGRARDLSDENEAMNEAFTAAEKMIALVGEDMSAWIVMEVERAYWEARNTAGQTQKNRQDRLGMGWANHDHHTFRSTRRHFPGLVRLMEMLGFHCRERFYAGEEAGWGAQVMENTHCGLVCFLDLDLAPEELEIDFAHETLPEREKLGTIGLWCELHGDSILKAGMHHLEAQFMFDELKEDLSHHGLGMMDPFSNFPYLKQAFTHGEQWVVDPQRIRLLIDKRLISKEEGDRFKRLGAVGSHMENLQRRDGYKGFNQKNVSYIIGKTDPRKLMN